MLDRMFYARTDLFEHKPGAAVASARRGGTTAALEALNKYLTIAQMAVPGSTYWNMVHGTTPEEVRQDLGDADHVELPQAERTYTTNFIR